MLLFGLLGAVVPVQLHVVPQGIESVNGSDVNMGCGNPLVNCAGVMVCGNCSSSYLVDDISPAINISTSDWASQLVTVKKSFGNLDYEHVLLTFGFATAVTLTSIKLDLFLCPEWNIGAPFITVYADNNANLNFNSSFISSYDGHGDLSSCDSLSTVTITLEVLSSYHTWHILVTFELQPDTEWVHIGEVRFMAEDSSTTCTTILSPGEYHSHKLIYCAIIQNGRMGVSC